MTEKKLSPRQKEALEKLSETEWQSPYDLQVSLATLNSLYRKGLVERQLDWRAEFAPRNETKFRKIRREKT